MKRGVAKRQLDKKLVLDRKTLDTRYMLTLNEDRCVGCKICEIICPEQAPKLTAAVTKDGKLIQKPSVDFEADKCTFCGECVDLCPTNAISIEINGELRVPVFEVSAFPVLRKLVAIDAKKCWWGAPTAACGVKCQEECPRDAIEVTTEKVGEDPAGRIVDFKVLEDECIFCRKCEIACPEKALHVINPVQGTLELNTELCPKGCQICADICPTEAIAMGEDGTLLITEEICIYCGACQEICPENAIKVERRRLLHTDVQSGAWVIALEKLTSLESLIKDLRSKSRTRRCARIKSLVGERQE